MLLLPNSHALMHWMHRLGGPGLILLAQVDNSPIPVPGSMDVLLIILCTSRKDLWLYYAAMALVGSIIAGFMTYRLSKKGGKETLGKRLGEKRAKKVYSIFEKYGFLSIFLGAMAPPPVPMSAVLMAAGAMQYPLKKFLAALTLGRALRYTLLAYLASLYGHALIRGMNRYYKPLLIFLIVLAVAGALVALFYWRRHKKQSGKPKKSRTAPMAA